MNYPTPEENRLCQCKGDPMKSFWCAYGHMLECHYPLRCGDAACSHLSRYGYNDGQIEKLEKQVRNLSELGIVPYTFDENGNAIVKGDQL